MQNVSNAEAPPLPPDSVTIPGKSVLRKGGIRYSMLTYGFNGMTATAQSQASDNQDPPRNYFDSIDTIGSASTAVEGPQTRTASSSRDAQTSPTGHGIELPSVSGTGTASNALAQSSGGQTRVRCSNEEFETFYRDEFRPLLLQKETSSARSERLWRLLGALEGMRDLWEAEEAPRFRIWICAAYAWWWIDANRVNLDIIGSAGANTRWPIKRGDAGTQELHEFSCQGQRTSSW
jgi:hypothetical protein